MTDKHILIIAKLSVVVSSAVILVSLYLLVIDILNQLGL